MAEHKLSHAAPFWMSLILAVLAIVGATLGGWYIILLPLYAMVISSIIDRIIGDNKDNPDPNISTDRLFWHELITKIWFPVQFVFVYFAIAAATRFDHLSTSESIYLMMSVGVATGGVGIVYAHELIHQRNKLERTLGDALLAMVLYGHFRTSHILIHHRYVGTPADQVTARYNEGFHRFLWRVLTKGFLASWRMEASRLAKRERSLWHTSNPFWRYFGWGLAFWALAGIIGGWFGLVLFVVQVAVAVLFLELTNYVEHYGLVREYLGDGKYENVKPRHSWNSARRFTNYLLINLQRHSDHHYKPDRRYPLLQTYEPNEAPELPFGYPLLAAIAMVPPIWRRMMNPRVRKWRADHYPHIKDWTSYKTASNPMPKGY